MLRVKQLGLKDYASTWQQMREFTDARGSETPDEIWLLEHPPVFTQGQAGRAEHVLNPGNIPVIQTDRGGQVTYHGPGQLVAYLLFDLKRLDTGIRTFVTTIEQAVINLLAEYGINAHGDRSAPGVYVEGHGKICAIGLRVRHGCTYHGIAFNINMDLEPYSRINPCGVAQSPITQTADLGGPTTVQEAGERFVQQLRTLLVQ
ncbi:MAG TPA: lipoyl(octanoyl) transferase LipB [Gammaproteobacteria bacterium]|nr:lipoyl(octanoyl) transferase LipB [Gammaproteobacteria bacterium]